MNGNFCTCFEDGGFDAGFSKLAAGILTQEDALPGPMQREQIASSLLQEAVDDGAVERVWDHAGHLATMADYPNDLADPHAD